MYIFTVFKFNQASFRIKKFNLVFTQLYYYDENSLHKQSWKNFLNRKLTTQLVSA